MALYPSTIRLDLKCGKSGISKGEKCHKGTPTQKALTAGAVGLGIGLGTVALGLAAYNAAGRRSSGSFRAPTPPSSTALAPTGGPQPSGGPVRPVRVSVEQPRLPGSSPRALLTPARIPKSKTQRMRENTRAAMQVAEGRIAQTAREEVRRVAQIGNTMAAAGEATGMAVKTGLREVRLRTEAARRRFEPGYRATPATTPKPPKQLPSGGDPLSLETIAKMPAPELREFLKAPARPTQRDPRTGQPKRKQARGFASRGDNYIPHYATTYIDPARQRP